MFGWSSSSENAVTCYIVMVQIVDGNQVQIFPSYIPVIVKRYNGCHHVDFCQGSWRNNIYYYPWLLDLVDPLTRKLFSTLMSTLYMHPLCPLPTHINRLHPPPENSFRNHQSSRSKFFRSLSDIRCFGLPII